MAAKPRLIVGIDLGTTNCALAWADLARAAADAVPRVHRFAVAQLVAEGEVAALPTLPSFLYFPSDPERSSQRLGLPWSPRPDRVAGAWARDHGALLPGRLVSSAKSWLCHGDVDRHAAILPWEAEPADRMCSPVAACAEYLLHLREAWDQAMAAGDSALRLQQQEIVLTLPASFDEEARELTVEAARAAGLEHLTLQEEPTAALYAWLGNHADRIRQELHPGDTVLVCDVGGGTTDFTLVAVRAAAAGRTGELDFERTAVGDHLMLGGDNLDLALAHLVESRLDGPPLTLRQRHALRRQASAAKERLLAPGAPDRVTVSVLGSGRAVVGGTLSAELRLDDVRRVLLDGFLPFVAASERPMREARGGLRELGLPYEADPAITRHLARFLAEAGDGTPARPDVLLLTGGFFTPAEARARMVDVLRRWFGGADPAWQPRVLVNESSATAVAEGAAYYGLARHGLGARIGGGSPRAYYLGLTDPGGDGARRQRGVCVLARGTEAGSHRMLDDRAFEVVANQPRAFSLWSSRRHHHGFGEVVELDEQTDHRLAPLVAELRFGKRSRTATLAVALEAGYTELGTLELWLASRSTEHRWRLQFELRAAGRPPSSEASDADATGEAAAAVEEEALAAAVATIAAVFAPASAGAAATSAPADRPSTVANSTIDQLSATLEGRIGLGRAAWPLAAIRRMADVFLERAEGRRRSARHEARWVNLTGFCLRPGFGATLDEFRVGQVWRLARGGAAFGSDVQCQAEWLVLWQRVAGGLTGGQQLELYQRHGTPLFAWLGKKGKRPAARIEVETWRLLASLERLAAGTRTAIGEHVLARLERQRDDRSLWWCLGRIGARTPVYGPLNTVVPPNRIAKWIERIGACGPSSPEAMTAVADLVALTGDAARDVDRDTREHAGALLRQANAPQALLARLSERHTASRAELQRRYGESLPEGLSLVGEAAAD